jgi:hypothetical protein
MSDALLHEKSRNLPIAIETLDHIHAAGLAGGGRVFGVEKRTGRMEAGVFLQ